MKRAERIVRTTEIKPLTLKPREELRKLAELPDGEIDFSDIPEIKDVKVFGRGPLTAEERKQLLAFSRLPDSEVQKLPPGYVVGGSCKIPKIGRRTLYYKGLVGVKAASYSPSGNYA